MDRGPDRGERVSDSLLIVIPIDDETDGHGHRLGVETDGTVGYSQIR